MVCRMSHMLREYNLLGNAELRELYQHSVAKYIERQESQLYLGQKEFVPTNSGRNKHISTQPVEANNEKSELETAR